MIALIKPILFTFIKGKAVKQLIIDLLTKIAEQTDNDLDDTGCGSTEGSLWRSDERYQNPSRFLCSRIRVTDCRLYCRWMSLHPRLFRQRQDNITHTLLWVNQKVVSLRHAWKWKRKQRKTSSTNRITW